MFVIDPIKRFILTAEGDPPEPPTGGAGEPPAEPGAEPKAPAAGAAPAAPTGEGTPPAEPPKAPAPPGWTQQAYDRQLERQHRKIKELEGKTAKSAELEADNARLRQLLEAKAPAGAQPPAEPPVQRPTPPAPAAPANIDTIRAQERFNIQVEELGQRCESQFAKDWPEAAKNFERLGGLPPQLVQGVLAYGADAPRLLVELGKNPELFQRLSDPDLPQAQQLKLLGDVVRDTAPAPKEPVKRPSGAPPPVDPLHPPAGSTPAQGSVDLYEGAVATTDEMGRITAKITSPVSDDAWYAERMRQKRESQGRPWSPGRGAPR